MDTGFKDFFNYLLKRWWILVAAILTGFIVAFLSTTFLMEKKYVSRVVFAFEDKSNTNKDLTIEKKYVARSVLTLTENVYLKGLSAELETNNSPNKPEISVDKRLSTDYTVKMLAAAISASYDYQTYTIEIKIKTNDANDSDLIAQAITGELMLKKLAGGTMNDESKYNLFKVVTEPEVNNSPVSPNLILNLFLGIFLGLITGVVISILIEKLDVRVKGELDLLDKYDLPILGSIPTFTVSDEVI